jgi:fumarylacetoacetase
MRSAMSEEGFGLANLPYGVFRAGGGEPRVGVRYGFRVLDLAALARGGLLDDPGGVFARPSLNAFMAAGPAVWASTRARVRDVLSGVDAEPPLLDLADVELLRPIHIADYVDFWSSIEHASNSGRIFRPGSEPLPRQWRHLPVGYHGRAGTVVVSDTPVRRPHGQGRGEDSGPVFGPSRKLDVELELGFVIGMPSAIGEPVALSEALEHVFGVVLLNDWSARDLQAWESQPLGPFLGKSFATSISAWVVPLEALAPFRVRAPPQEPEPLPYLREPPWALDIDLELELNLSPVARTSARHLYWSVAQQVAHLTSNGASLRTGDLLGSGTISGPEREQRGSLLELSWNGTEPFRLADGSERTFLEDGDEVVVRGMAGRGDDAVALGEVRGRIVR